MAPSVTLPLDERRAIVENQGINITLNGRTARILGWRNDFATVGQIGIGPSAMSVEFAWPTVKHIIENKGGQFKA